MAQRFSSEELEVILLKRYGNQEELGALGVYATNPELKKIQDRLNSKIERAIKDRAKK